MRNEKRESKGKKRDYSSPESISSEARCRRERSSIDEAIKEEERESED